VKYPLQTTQVPRASMSGNAWAYAVFGQDEGKVGPENYQPIYSFSDSNEHDYNLRFFDNCPKYKKEKTNKIYKEDKSKWEKTVFPDIAKRLSNQIAGNDDFVTEKEVGTYFDLCGFEFAIQNERGKFCSLFTKEDFLISEISADLGATYSKGYGWDFSYKMACPLLEDIVDRFKFVVNGTDTITSAYLRFAHAETVLPLLCILGLYKDDFELHWDTDRKLLDNRKYRTSHICPFSANVVFILHKCGSKHLVEVLHNEGQVKFEKCGNKAFCPFEEFVAMFADVLPCPNFEEMCHRDACTPAKKKCIGDICQGGGD